ncbi:hypothetical protein KKH43_05110 [Patescibacteria group bacterium]|nr:hypothetical protein [Patescibacteria group bacterium]
MIAHKKKNTYLSFSFLFLGIFCVLLTPFVLHAESDSSSELKALENDIKLYKDSIEKLDEQKATLENEIELLDAQIKKTQAETKKTMLRLQKIEDEIEKTSIKIQTTKNEIEKQKETLKDYLRLINEYDQLSLVETLFSTGSLSGLFNQIQYAETLQVKTNETLQTFKELQELLKEKQQELSLRQEEETVLLAQLDAQEEELSRQQENKELLLEQTSGEEERFQELMTKAEGKREQIVLTLIESQTRTGGFSLSEAQVYAEKASEKTGVRKGILLAIVEQESYFGRNVGTGYYKTDMQEKYWDEFESVCETLGLDPEATPVSNKPKTYTGWGGAMGAGQIMPYEWLRVRGEVAKLTGHELPSPWNPEDAMMGVGVILRGLGAANPDGEFEACGRYFAGGYWKKYSWYAEQVLKKATKYE